ncbi:hypothetical protein N6B72_13745 [Chryseobacterium soli]|uniref:Uncharacterized protein n=1 Tax=Chryseobacterium soli TaxID=445961 RepID=A0A086A2X8_9FLAO|nr:hypothetical protein [Chryseobacterium soli]KFF11042.1 hypothetical protein IW15_17930 [Chryseobacterium soli]MDV7697984.1 hypothetical protein [Chryseobacterium soli]
MKKIIHFFAIVLFIYGAISWFLVPHFFKKGEEFVLSDARSFVADSKNIYIYGRFYSAVNVYDTFGKFITSFPVKGYKGEEKLYLTQNDELAIAHPSEFSDRLTYYYSKDGKFLGENSFPIQDTISRDNRYYAVPLVCYKLYRKQNNKDVLILKQSYWKTLLTPPFSLLISLLIIFPTVFLEKFVFKDK